MGLTRRDVKVELLSDHRTLLVTARLEASCIVDVWVYNDVWFTSYIFVTWTSLFTFYRCMTCILDHSILFSRFWMASFTVGFKASPMDPSGRWSRRMENWWVSYLAIRYDAYNCKCCNYFPTDAHLLLHTVIIILHSWPGVVTGDSFPCRCST